MSRSSSEQKPAPDLRHKPGASSAWKPVLCGLGTAALLAIGGHTLALLDRSTRPRPAEEASQPAPDPESPPGAPVQGAAAPAVSASREAAAPAHSPLHVRRRVPAARGAAGVLGPVRGALSANLDADAPLLGPTWERKPLPKVTAVLTPPHRRQPAARVPDRPKQDPLSSEIPDAGTLALSRLANPEPEVRTASPQKTGEVSAEHPLTLSLSVEQPVKAAAETVAVRISASADCYALLVRVDASGKASILFRSPGPSRHFAAILKAGPAAGTEYLLAFAAVHPLSGAEVAAALRRSGAGFSTAIPASAGSTAPAEAWNLALAQAAATPGEALSPRWQRFEWAVATASFGTRPAADAPASKAAAEAASARPTGKQVTAD